MPSRTASRGRAPGRAGYVVLAVVALLALIVYLVWPSGTPAAQWRSAGAVPPSSAAPTSAAPGPQAVTILGAGDVLIHPQVWEQAKRDGGGAFDFAPMFAGVTPAISGADLALCHLEIPLADADGPFRGYPTFNAPPQVLNGLAKAGFDGCSTASNHSLDQGMAGITRTVAAFEAAKLGHTGTFASATDADRLQIYDVRGVKVGHLSYTAHFNGLTPPAGKLWSANRIDPVKIKAAAGRLRAGGADIIVLSLHWGTEYQHAPDASQRNWARDLAKSPDIDLILGHHAHVVQPIEKIGDTWVVYGMGNELARHAEPVNANREGLMVRTTFTESGGSWKVSKIEAIPTWTDLTPAIRLVDLSTSSDKPEYKAAYDRIRGHVLSRGGEAAGLVLAHS